MKKNLWVLWLVAVPAVLLFLAWLAGCSFSLLPNGLFGDTPAGKGIVQPPPVESPSGQGNQPTGDSIGQWEWLSDPALWSSVAFGVVYVGNQVRKSRKYRNG